MQNGVPDKANVIALPPLIYAVAFVVGWLLHLVLPTHFLPLTLARWIGVVLVLASIPIAKYSTIIILIRSGIEHDICDANAYFPKRKI